MDMNARAHNMDYESLVKKQSITYRVGKRFFDIVLCLVAMFLLIIVTIPINCYMARRWISCVFYTGKNRMEWKSI